MGDISEMMLDGTLCQYCGIVIVDYDEEPCGYPQSCDECEQ